MRVVHLKRTLKILLPSHPPVKCLLASLPTNFPVINLFSRFSCTLAFNLVG